MGQTRAKTAALATATFLALAACSSDSDTSAPPTPSPTPTVATVTAAVPDITGMSQDDAFEAITDAGFTPKVRGTGSIVIGQTPGAGRHAEVGSDVKAIMGRSDEEIAAETQAAAEKAAADLAASNESAMCGPFRATLADPLFSPTQITYNAVTNKSVYLAPSASSVPIETFVQACPEFAPLLADMDARVAAGELFEAGVYEVGVDVPAGTYKTTGTDIKDCYWSRTTGGGDIIDNDFVGYAPAGVTIAIRAGEGLEVSDNCGLWVRQ